MAGSPETTAMCPECLERRIWSDFAGSGLSFVHGLSDSSLPFASSAVVQDRVRNFTAEGGKIVYRFNTEFEFLTFLPIIVIYKTIFSKQGMIQNSNQKRLGDLVCRNVIHGSDSVENGKKEIAFWFPEDVAEWKSNLHPWIYKG